MPANVEELRDLREQINTARAEAMRLGKVKLGSILTASILALEVKISRLDRSYAGTMPQVEALKRMIGAT